MMFKYTVREGAIGIFILIDIEEIINPVLGEEDLQFAQGIYLRCNKLPFLSKEEIELYIKKAILELSEAISLKTNGSSVCFYIKAVHTNLCDFQSEGLYGAMRGWLGQYYNLKLEPIEVKYSKEQRRFIFNI